MSNSTVTHLFAFLTYIYAPLYCSFARKGSSLSATAFYSCRWCFEVLVLPNFAAGKITGFDRTTYLNQKPINGLMTLVSYEKLK